VAEIAVVPSAPFLKLKRFKDPARYALIVTLAAIILITAIGNPRFLSPTNIFNILLQISVLGIVAAGQTLLIVSAGLDLSVGALLSVSAIVGGLIIHASGSTALGVVAAVLSGLIMGAANGALIATGRAHPFILTLGTMTLLQGAALVLSDGAPINGMGWLFDYIGLGDLFGVPTPIYFLVAVVLIVHFILSRTSLGRYAYAIGGNENATRLSGVPVGRIKIVLYAVNGLIVGIGAVVLAGVLDSALTTMGNGYELRAIAAVVIGGTPLVGGRGNVLGTFGGVLLLGLVSNSMNLLGVGANYQNLTLGLIVTIAVLLQKQR
jgi:ribose/xylose/arabinose/galactoside ABC-type transport system permease subunit